VFWKNRNLKFKELTHKRSTMGKYFVNWHGCFDGDSLTKYLEGISWDNILLHTEANLVDANSMVIHLKIAKTGLKFWWIRYLSGAMS